MTPRLAWKTKICAAAQRAVESWLEVGKLLIAAKAALPHGDFQSMIRDDLPFSPRMAQKLMVIARDERLTKTNLGSHLPTAFKALHELTRLDDETFAAALASGAINRDTTERQARELVKPLTPTTSVAVRVTSTSFKVRAPAIVGDDKFFTVPVPVPKDSLDCTADVAAAARVLDDVLFRLAPIEKAGADAVVKAARAGSNSAKWPAFCEQVHAASDLFRRLEAAIVGGSVRRPH